MRRVVVLPEPLGPRKPQMRPCSIDEVEMIDDGARAVALHQVVDVDGQRHEPASPRGTERRHADRQAGRQRHLRRHRFGPRLDQEDQLGPRALRVDHRRRELGARRDVDDVGLEIGRAAVAGEAHLAAHARLRDVLLGHEETQLHARGRQQRHHRRARRHPFADIEEGVLDQRVLGRHRHQVGEPLLRRSRLASFWSIIAAAAVISAWRAARSPTRSWAASEASRARSWETCDSAWS